MYPYNNRNEYRCFDDSPTFDENPSTVICTGYPFTYNPNAWNTELDSLVYSWAEPLDSNLQPITTWVSGYDSAHPLPGPVFNPGNIS